MKNYLALLLPVLFTLVLRGNVLPIIDERVMQSFAVLFPSAKNIKWNETSEAYIVHFTDGGTRSRIVYDKASTLFHFTRYYMGENLPYSIQIKLKRDYPGKYVVGVTEISRYLSSGKALHVEYFVTLQDKHWLLNLRIKRNGKFTVVNRFIKQQTH